MIDKKQKVIETARKLFTEKGYKKVSMDEIALGSSVTKRTIYCYFKDKEELFRFFIVEELIKMKEIVEEIDQKNISFFDKTHSTLYELLKYKKNNQFLNMIAKEASEIKTIAAIHYSKMINEHIEGYIKEKLTTAISKNYIKECDVEICTFLIYKLYMAILFEWDNDNKELNEKEITENVTRILKTGIFN